MSVFYKLEGVPAHSVLLMPTRDMAVGYRRGDIALGYCRACGFISNTAFDPALHEYSSRYEGTQAFSPTFNSFHQRLAARLIEKYNLHDKDIIEIGCGKGEFITILCELGSNRGVGFDPSYVSERNPADPSRVTFVDDFYSEKYAGYQADFVCCKMTLEHIQRTGDFLRTLRRSIGKRRDTLVFFQVPDVTRVLRELAFWDIYYEHCSYFSPGSLARLFRHTGFAVVDLTAEYDGQYLMIEARTEGGQSTPSVHESEAAEDLARAVEDFSRDVWQRIEAWRGRLQRMLQDGRRVVLWGAGSKAVAFLTTLGLEDGIEYAVDINPYKSGMYLPGTGQQIVGPAFLADYKPDTVIVMNPVYVDEIRQELCRMRLHPDLIAV